MSIEKMNIVPLSFVTVALAVLPGCGYTPGTSTAIIHYSQVGACNGYLTGSGITAKRPNQAFVVFKIESFDLAKSGVDYYFFPARLYVDLEPHRETWGSSLGAGKYFASKDRRFTDPLGVASIEPVKALPRVVTTIDRFAFIALPTKDENGAAEASKTSYHLSYDVESGKEGGGPASPNLEFVKTNDTQSTWPATDDCLHLEISKK